MFTENYSGRKGSAVYIKNMNRIRITNCTFQNNGPVFSYLELDLSPYHIYFSTRSLTYYDEREECFDEFNYIESCYNPNSTITWS
jgi:hypothetical protein